MARDRVYNLGVYEKALPADLSWREKLQAAKEAGFDFIEISLDESEEKISRLYWDQQEREELRKAIRETGTPIRTMCFSCCRKYSLGTLDPEKKPRVMELVARAIEFADDIGIRIVQMSGYDAYYEPRSEATRQMFIENLKKAAKLAAARGVLLGFETQMDSDHMDAVSKIMNYVNIVQSPYVNAYPDIGNLCLSKIQYGWDNISDDLRSGKGHIIAAHLKETLPGIDRGVPYGTGVTEYDEALPVLKELGVRLFNAEFWNDQPDHWFDYMSESSAFLRQKLDKVFDD